MSVALRIAESGFAPDRLIRAGIRTLNRQRLRDERRDSIEALREHQQAFIASLRQSPIAVESRAANEQHYEVPPAFFLHALGKRLKYSCCYYPAGNESLDQAEEQMLALTCERAQVRWYGDPGARLRLGLANALDGGALPEGAHYRSL
jgi:cyclopropane-fatty-acyl-phospholipid synthase